MRGEHNKLGEGERKVRLGQDSLPNIAISVAETSGYYIRCFTRTPIFVKTFLTAVEISKCDSTVVKHSTLVPKFEGSNPASGNGIS